MDNVVINITELPNNVSFQITEDTDNVTINIIEGGGGMQCADLAACQTIIDIESGIIDLQQQIDNLPTTTPNLQQVVTESPIVDGLLAQSLNGLADISITDNYVQVNVNDGTNFAQHTVQATNVTTTVNVTGSVITDGNIEFATPSLTKNGVEIATENFVDNRVQSNIKIVGDWDATSGSYPLADESNTTPFITQWGATIKAGWAFRVGYGQAGTVDGFDYENGDVVYALIDSPTDNASDWGDLDHNLQQANESLRGTAKVITAAIISNENTTDDERFVTAKKLWLNFWTRVLAIAHTFAAKITFTTAPRFSSTNAGEYLKVNGTKDLTSVSVIPRSDVGIHEMFITTGNQTTASTASSNITGLSSVTLEANKRYYFDGIIHLGCSNTGGVKLQVDAPAGSTLFIGLVGNSTASTNTSWQVLIASGTLSGLAYTLQNNPNGQVRISGEVQMGATAGTVDFGFASSINLQTSTVYQLGTFITYKKID